MGYRRASNQGCTEKAGQGWGPKLQWQAMWQGETHVERTRIFGVSCRGNVGVLQKALASGKDNGKRWPCDSLWSEDEA